MYVVVYYVVGCRYLYPFKYVCKWTTFGPIFQMNLFSPIETLGYPLHPNTHSNAVNCACNSAISNSGLVHRVLG